MNGIEMGNFGAVEKEKLEDAKRDVLFQVHELYFQRIFSYKEAEQIVRNIHLAETLSEMKNIIEGPFASADNIYQLDHEKEQGDALDILFEELGFFEGKHLERKLAKIAK
jgi:hypothetical protein